MSVKLLSIFLIHGGATITVIVITLLMWRGHCSRHCGAVITDIQITLLRRRHRHSSRHCGVTITEIMITLSSCDAATTCAIATRPLRRTQPRSSCGTATARSIAAQPSLRLQPCCLLWRGHCSRHCGAGITEIVITLPPTAGPLLASLQRVHHRRRDRAAFCGAATACVMDDAFGPVTQ